MVTSVQLLNLIAIEIKILNGLTRRNDRFRIAHVEGRHVADGEAVAGMNVRKSN